MTFKYKLILLVRVGVFSYTFRFGEVGFFFLFRFMFDIGQCSNQVNVLHCDVPTSEWCRMFSLNGNQWK